MKKIFTFLFTAICLASIISCSKSNSPAPQPAPPVIPVAVNAPLYFPPLSGSEWQSVTPASLGWDEAGLNNLYPYLESQHTKAFIILKNGKIVAEKYFGSFTADSLWYWASAGKIMSGFTAGIAQQEGLIDINKPVSQYLGTGWTAEPLAKENLITVKNQLTMTTGLDDNPANNECIQPGCLIYKADAGTRWAYHNAAYTLLDKVIENASKLSYNVYFQQKVRDRTGMNGLWVKTAKFNNLYYSNARSMARFGLLMLNKGKWDNTVIMSDTSYFNNQVNTSQKFNLSYGYLTWLNGKASSMVPQSQIVFPTAIVPNAPADMYAGLGGDDQKLYIVPSQKLVIIRMGESAGGFTYALSGFDNELWGKLKTIIKY